jgi:hypothetical protein
VTIQTLRELHAIGQIDQIASRPMPKTSTEILNMFGVKAIGWCGGILHGKCDQLV